MLCRTNAPAWNTSERPLARALRQREVRAAAAQRKADQRIGDSAVVGAGREAERAGRCIARAGRRIAVGLQFAAVGRAPHAPARIEQVVARDSLAAIAA